MPGLSSRSNHLGLPPSQAKSIRDGQVARAEHYFADLLAQADVRVDGARPWDFQVHDRSLFDRTLTGGSLAFGES
jgi:cyclopropane-fatty-acyl-phospholipid synthase